MHDAHPIEAVIFDMDGLLLDSERLAMEALVAAGDELGYELPEAFCQAMIGVPADRCRAMVVETYGEEFPLERYFAAQEVHLRAMVDNGRLGTKAGVGELLELLDAHGVPRAIATSSSRYRTDHHLALAGIDGRFQAIVTRDDVTRGKPYPDPYLIAAQRLGVAAANCLALEDSYNGIRAAHAAQIRVIMIPDLLPPTDEMRDTALRVVDSLHDVVEWLTPRLPARGA